MDQLADLFASWGAAGNWAQYGIAGIIIILLVNFLKKKKSFVEMDAAIPQIPLVPALAAVLSIIYAISGAMPNAGETLKEKVITGITMGAVLVGSHATKRARDKKKGKKKGKKSS